MGNDKKVLQDINNLLNENKHNKKLSAPVDLETMKMRSGEVLVRPAGQLGTDGFSPKAWTITAVGKGQNPISAFLAKNKGWSKEEIAKVLNEGNVPLSLEMKKKIKERAFELADKMTNVDQNKVERILTRMAAEGDSLDDLEALEQELEAMGTS